MTKPDNDKRKARPEVSIPLPRATDGEPRSIVSPRRQITLIGGNGAGKSRFMDEMAALSPGRTYILSALSASFPERAESKLPGSVDSLYRIATERHPYLRPAALSELDKLTYMLFADELESLLEFKDSLPAKKNKILPRASRLDKVKELWHKIFPGSEIVRSKGALMFSTPSGDDLIETDRLSQGEKAVFYYSAAVLYAMPGAIIFIDSPTLFLHRSIIGPFWNAIERMRPDCTFVYNTVDVDFVGSRSDHTCIWVKSYDPSAQAWDYEVLPDSALTEDIFVELAGSRRPVLFIEGDARHSIDARLYPLVFSGWDVRPLGSCNKVIETTRTFNDLKSMHHLRSRGIVDRDRRTDAEVRYLRNKEILVPDVAEVENLFLLEPVIKIMARRRGRRPDRLFARVKRDVMRMFSRRADEQALQHVRHRVKREVECKIDARFSCITALETHLRQLPSQLQPRKHYNDLRAEFARILGEDDYNGVLRVFNHKPMLPDSGLPQLLGYRSKEEYVNGVLDLLRENSDDARTVRNTIRFCFHADETQEAK